MSNPKSEAAYFKDLNDSQRLCVEATQGPLLILAGAGTGKTRTLTARLAHLLAMEKTRPERILAVTFTNKAARELGERARRFVGEDIVLPWLGTFHAMGVRMLRRHAPRVGRRSDFTILDEADQLRLLKQLLSESNTDPAKLPPQMARHLIARWKDKAWAPEQIPPDEAKREDGRVLKLYKAYQQSLKNLNAMDFGDLLMEGLQLFQKNEEILSQYQNHFAYIFVDEYQDTNVAQYLWLRLLALNHRNICCVGDDDQSIYGWRGAEVDNILRFEKDFPGAQVIRLECNYRSTQHILGAAAGVVAHNRSRLGKSLHTMGAEGEKVQLLRSYDGKDEAQKFCHALLQRREEGCSLNEMAVLVRSGAQIRPFEETLLELGVAYRIIGSVRFYERAEIRDLLAYLRLLLRPHDDLAFQRIVNTPKRGIGGTTITRLRALAAEKHVALLEACDLDESDFTRGGIRKAGRDRLKAFAAMMRDVKEKTSRLPPDKILENMMETSGYKKMWGSMKTPDAEQRLENMGEMVQACQDFATLEDYLEHVSLVMDRDSDAGEEKVNLMTLHAAKGLEFDAVFLPGWEEGLIPHMRTLMEGGHQGLEEERRLAHVGMTRARKYLSIGWAQSRQIHGLWQDCTPSRFISEIPPAHREEVKIEREPQSAAPLLSHAHHDREEKPNRKKENKSAPLLFSEGGRVYHAQLGRGKVQDIDGDKITVLFDKGRRAKKIKAGFLTTLPKKARF